MTNSPAGAGGRTRSAVPVLVVLTGLLLTPLCAAFWWAVNNAIEHKSGTDWAGNHETKVGLEHAAVLLAGLPLFGLAAGWTGATVLGRRPAVGAAAGALLGTAGVWVVGIGAVFSALSNWTFEF
ncbi:hypothetical protein [Streptomyces sp. NRRL S-87]|uniref:hypothetical protein n=1 Tax=Streptomyces sp. NRRL S-87 TaxID=1463920 RepID=UPI0004BEB346|nr:hypothetical protein [Streptomyces sp. NRRL S-87]